MKYLGGLDIGGTKCAAVLGELGVNGSLKVLCKEKFATAEVETPRAAIDRLLGGLERQLREHSLGWGDLQGIGISCGGPLDSRRGVILSPPNLPGWDEIPVTDWVRERTGVAAYLENDANACALAEWKFGAGRGTRDMIFLTFGTGLGAGIIVNGTLLTGRCGMGGEVGHIRLAPTGPVGYGKSGSFEGFCSGGGIAQLAGEAAARLPAAPVWECTAKSVGDAAEAGDETALAIYRESGRRLGEGLSILIDLFNPELIVIGSIFVRSGHLLRPFMEEVIRREALPQSVAVCKVVPAALGESLGDIAALSIPPAP